MQVFLSTDIMWDREKMVCPNCESKNTYSVYRVDSVSTYQNVLLPSLKEALEVPKGIIDLNFCTNCTFLYNVAFNENLVGYGPSYENDQTCSEFFNSHVECMVEKLIHDCKIDNHKILEIGCGNGYFLRKILDKIHKNIGVGFDKSLKSDIKVDNGVTLYGKYYDENDVENFDVVVSRHVVEHILVNKNLLRLLNKKNPNARFFIETPSLEWIIENNVFFDIFYEHCSYFSGYSFCKLAEKCDLSIINFERVFNDQYMWIECVSKKNKSIDIERSLSLEKINKFFRKKEFIEENIRNIMISARKKGSVFIWGAGAKGLTFANILDSTRQYIDCLVDINPKKQDMYCAGTGHIIKSPDCIKNNNFKTIFIMNKNYMSEIVKEFSRENCKFICIEDLLIN